MLALWGIGGLGLGKQGRTSQSPKETLQAVTSQVLQFAGTLGELEDWGWATRAEPLNPHKKHLSQCLGKVDSIA